MKILELSKNKLCSMQLDDGSFPIQQLISGEGARVKEKTNGLFSTCEVLLAAGSILPLKTVENSLLFIKAQQQPNKHWNWDPSYGIPDDADDTSCAIATICRFNGMREKEITSSRETLTSYWDNKFKIFKTWNSDLVPWCNSDRFDAVVNCNCIAALREINHKELDYYKKHIQKMIKNNDNSTRTRYYCSFMSFYYAATRAQLEFDIIELEYYIKISFHRLNDLEIAQGLLILSELHPQSNLIEDLTKKLLSCQQSDFSWKSCAWCDGEGLLPWGSEAVTTAIALKGLANVMS